MSKTQTPHCFQLINFYERGLMPVDGNPVDGNKVKEVLIAITNVIEANKDYLCALDSEVGDGDHGVSMTIGMRTARKALTALQHPSPESAFRAVAEAFADEVGAASGVLYETAFEAAAKSVAGKISLETSADWASVLEAIANEIQTIGKVQLGDKTMFDAWFPAAMALRAAANQDEFLPRALQQATAAALKGVEDTKNLIPKRGRASRLGERARGHQDAGATSAYLMIQTIEESMKA
jgi:phosphoenolpyruvate---glycerone phosphotransferase subunit DhaL